MPKLPNKQRGNTNAQVNTQKLKPLHYAESSSTPHITCLLK